ncbi:MAG TPA: rhodanese-like domain-containing protein, partial [Vicinamibacterales bacterium]|nr:rhodanese-like domain-containing protein [Vicinamibacterales bacterium]
LLGEAQTRQLANELFTSLQRVMALDDRTEVHPGHGAGSLCGAGIGRDPASSIGRERQQNALLQYRERDAFVAAVLADIPETPSYFSRMKRVNAAGPPILGLVDGDIRVPSLKPGAAAALAADGAVVIDLRSTDAFAAGHPYGALNIAYGPKVGYWAGWVVPDGTPMILLSDDPVHARAAAVQLLRVGLDRIEGTIVGGYDAWTADGLPGATVDRITAGQLRVMPMCIVDVRTPAEWRAGHVEGSINIPVGDILLRAHELVGDTPVATICEGGYRSSLAASLLLQEGVSHVVNVIGGMAACRDLERI